MSKITYRRNDEVIEIIIRDCSGAKIETHVCQASDKKKYRSILKYLKDKYGIDYKPEISYKESINWFG